MCVKKLECSQLQFRKMKSKSNKQGSLAGEKEPSLSGRGSLSGGHKDSKSTSRAGFQLSYSSITVTPCYLTCLDCPSTTSGFVPDSILNDLLLILYPIEILIF